MKKAQSEEKSLSDPVAKRPQLAYGKAEDDMFLQCGPLETQGKLAESTHLSEVLCFVMFSSALNISY